MWGGSVPGTFLWSWVLALRSSQQDRGVTQGHEAGECSSGCLSSAPCAGLRQSVLGDVSDSPPCALVLQLEGEGTLRTQPSLTRRFPGRIPAGTAGVARGIVTPFNWVLFLWS